MTDQPASPPLLTESVVSLGSHLVAEQKLWSALVRFARELSPWDWVLVGGQMVALHGYIAGTVPPRTSEDIDVVANVLVRRNSLEACASAAEHINLRPKPPMHGRRLQRFEGDGLKLDLLVPDHLPSKLHLSLRGHAPVPIRGGQRALGRAHVVTVQVGEEAGVVTIPDLRGALVLKSRAAVADTRDSERHISDIAFLCGLVDDPRQLAAELDTPERRYLRRITLPRDTRAMPWVLLDANRRDDALDTWKRITAS